MQKAQCKVGDWSSKNRQWERAKNTKNTLEASIAGEKALFDSATTPLEKKQALKLLSSAKKAWVKNRNTERFVASALSAPRGPRRVASTIYPLRVSGSLTMDATEWEAEFRREFGKLFVDPSNTPEAQNSRLLRLRQEFGLSRDIVIPLSMLNEHLQRGSRKWDRVAHSPSRLRELGTQARAS
jgi:hypothetical protein